MFLVRNMKNISSFWTELLGFKIDYYSRLTILTPVQISPKAEFSLWLYGALTEPFVITNPLSQARLHSTVGTTSDCKSRVASLNPSLAT